MKVTVFVLSKLIRRTHMYLALFLTPWMVMYALSTLAMNHRHFFEEYYGEPPARFQPEREEVYNGTFPEDAKPAEIARQILASLDLHGNFDAKKEADGRITIYRTDPITPRRVTYTPADGRLRIEKRLARAPVILEGLHRKRGFESKQLADDAWGFIVDLVIVAMVVWVLSGIWMWWEMKATRAYGALCAAGGVAIFVFFLATI